MLFELQLLICRLVLRTFQTDSEAQSVHKGTDMPLMQASQFMLLLKRQLLICRLVLQILQIVLEAQLAEL